MTAKLVGVDPSAGYVQHVRQRTGDHRADFLIGDAHKLEFADGTFDVVVSGLVLNFLSDRHQALGEMKRVAREGGTVAAYVWDYPGQMQLMKYFWDTACDLDPAAGQLHEGRRFSFCQPDVLAAMFTAANLGNIETTAIVVPTCFADFADYWGPFLGGQAPAPSYAMSLDDDRCLALREAIRSRLPAGADGSIALTARAWAIHGRA
ncbi:MAG: class I SAM-dependent methyltransferase [Egibacteraceae bacterium]